MTQNQLEAAIREAHAYLATDDFQRLVVGRGRSDEAQLLDADVLSRLELSLGPSSNTSSVRSIHDEANRPYAEQDESYELEIPSKQDHFSTSPVHHTLSASLTANTTIGLLRGLQTFVQLVYSLSSPNILKPIRYILPTPIAIIDSPAFPHRGFMLDTSRNFYVPHRGSRANAGGDELGEAQRVLLVRSPQSLARFIILTNI